LNITLRWLNLSANRITCIDDLSNLQSLEVLKLSHNQISSLGCSLEGLPALKTIVIDHNCLKRLCGVENLKALETLIASHNEIEVFEAVKQPMKCLKKLSLSHNRLRKFPFSEKLFSVEELRLSNNRLQEIQETIKFMGNLKILEIGNNLLQSKDCLENCFQLIRLTTLNTHGNPYDTSQEEVKSLVISRMPRLKVFNSRPLTQQNGKQKRKPPVLADEGTGQEHKSKKKSQRKSD